MATKNSGAEPAMEWILQACNMMLHAGMSSACSLACLQHMEDANFNEPLAPEAPAKAAQFDADSIAVLGKHSACFCAELNQNRWASREPTPCRL